MALTLKYTMLGLFIVEPCQLNQKVPVMNAQDTIWKVIMKVNTFGKDDVFLLIPLDVYAKLGGTEGISQIHINIFGFYPIWTKLFDEHFTVQLEIKDKPQDELIKRFDDALAEALANLSGVL